MGFSTLAMVGKQKNYWYKPKSYNEPQFIASCISELKKTGKSFAYTISQIKEIKEKLKTNKKLIYRKEDFYYVLELDSEDKENEPKAKRK